MSWSQVPKEIANPGSKHQISLSTLRQTKNGRTAKADGILAMVRWLGMTFRDFSVGVKNPAPHGALKKSECMRRFDARAFYSDLDKERQHRGLSWKRFTEQNFPGWSPPMLTRLAEGGRMDASKSRGSLRLVASIPESFHSCYRILEEVSKGYCHLSLKTGMLRELCFLKIECRKIMLYPMNSRAHCYCSLVHSLHIHEEVFYDCIYNVYT